MTKAEERRERRKDDKAKTVAQRSPCSRVTVPIGELMTSVPTVPREPARNCAYGHRLVENELRNHQSLGIDLLGHQKGVIPFRAMASDPRVTWLIVNCALVPGHHGGEIIPRQAHLERNALNDRANDVKSDRGTLPTQPGRIRPAIKLALASVVPPIHESIEPGIDGGDDGVAGQETVVGWLNEAAIASLEDVDVADFDHVRPDVTADRLDNALRSQAIETGRPASQELANIFGRDRILLPGVILNHDPPGRDVDHFAPGTLRWKLR